MISKRQVVEFIYKLKTQPFITFKQKKYRPRCSGDTEMTSSSISSTVSGHVRTTPLILYFKHVAYTFGLRGVLFPSIFSLFRQVL